MIWDFKLSQILDIVQSWYSVSVVFSWLISWIYQTILLFSKPVIPAILRYLVKKYCDICYFEEIFQKYRDKYCSRFKILRLFWPTTFIKTTQCSYNVTDVMETCFPLSVFHKDFNFSYCFMNVKANPGSAVCQSACGRSDLDSSARCFLNEKWRWWSNRPLLSDCVSRSVRLIQVNAGGFESTVGQYALQYELLLPSSLLSFPSLHSATLWPLSTGHINDIHRDTWESAGEDRASKDDPADRGCHSPLLTRLSVPMTAVTLTDEPSLSSSRISHACGSFGGHKIKTTHAHIHSFYLRKTEQTIAASSLARLSADPPHLFPPPTSSSCSRPAN